MFVRSTKRLLKGAGVFACSLRGRRMHYRLVAAASVAALLLVSAAPLQSGAAQPLDPRIFPATGYSIQDDGFWAYFRQRGGLRTFGYPTSSAFPFLGCKTQFFQRLVMQQCGDSGVSLVNLLEEGLLPYTRINGSTFPAADTELIKAAPLPSDPAFAWLAIEFVRSNVPDVYDGQTVNFLRTFESSVSLGEAFPTGAERPDLLPLLDIEIWGLPTSYPRADPNNASFVYQRFQRGIMQYDHGTGRTQGLLLADYLKAVIIGRDVPPDLADQAHDNPLFGSAAGGSVPSGTNYTGAFRELIESPVSETEPGPAPVVPPSPPPLPVLVPLPSPVPSQALPLWTSGPYRVYASTPLHSALDYLRDSPYAWVLDRLTTYDIRVMFAESQHYWGSFSPLEQVIRINALLSRAAPETISAVLVHEALHATDYAAGRLGTSNECVSSERAAAEQVLEYWRRLYGWSGKVPPENSFEAQLNDMLTAFRRSRADFDRTIRELYEPQCS